ncbi:hypothetical protein [Microseira sp. BLCC-F43]|jgi:hypothetical protein|uniref:hypothetical protein n=1 Tax=Microseira sp. BLCC-F43 TaxID=3153602 RepID=UPI0035B71F2B
MKKRIYRHRDHGKRHNTPSPNNQVIAAHLEQLLTPAIFNQQEQLTSSLVAELSPSQQQIECQLRADGAIAFYFSAGENQVATYTKPRIEPDGNGVVLERWRVEGKEAPEELAPAAMAQVGHILSLGDLANRGTRFHNKEREARKPPYFSRGRKRDTSEFIRRQS